MSGIPASIGLGPWTIPHFLLEGHEDLKERILDLTIWIPVLVLPLS